MIRISVWHPRVSEVFLQHHLLVGHVIDTIPTPAGPNVGTMYGRIESHHVVVHFATQQGVPAHLVWQAEADALGQEHNTIFLGGVLQVCPVAVVLVCLADGVCKQSSHSALDLAGIVQMEHLPRCLHERNEEIIQPAEDGVILSDLAGGVVLQPGVNRGGDHQLEGGDVEGDEGGGRSGVVGGRELGDVVRDRRPEDPGVVGLRKETEDILVVEFATVEGASCVNTALDLRWGRRLERCGRGLRRGVWSR